MCFVPQAFPLESVMPQNRKRKRTFAPKKQNGAQGMRAARFDFVSSR
jgi:hypothetical protein